MIHRLAALFEGVVVFLMAIAISGCKCNSGPTDPNGAAGEGPDAAVLSEVKSVVQRLMEAARAGDVETFRQSYARPVDLDPDEVQPLEYEFEVRDAWLENENQARVHVYMKDPQITDAKNEFMLRYQLARQDGVWKVTDVKVRGYWEKDQPVLARKD